MSKGVKLLAALMEDDVGGGNNLMRAARTLAGAVSDLLIAVEPASGEVSRGTPRPRDHNVFSETLSVLFYTIQSVI